MAVKIIDSNLSKVALGILRNRDTSTAEFRTAAHKISNIILQHALEDISVITEKINTPLTTCDSIKLNSKIVFIPILRAGIAMLHSAISIVPNSQIGYIGLQRNEETALPEYYYSKLPNLSTADVVILDPMLATGGSIAYTIEELVKHNPRTIKVVSIISSQEGIAFIEEKFPTVEIFTAAVDPTLNEQKFIVPGLGDFGDRYHGTV
jgi:uracil phosphoribosyltransferase